ncbi:hypothetical protein SAMN02746095_02897 [Acidocella aminolytica 101 = DSM 11237]|nr:hypothetical protein SAMN02746095_02897 [Acidocella aminolytica 101 = DSM 11237]
MSHRSWPGWLALFLGAPIITEIFLPPRAYASSSAYLRQVRQNAAAAPAGSKSVVHADLQGVSNCLVGQAYGNYNLAVWSGFPLMGRPGYKIQARLLYRAV